MGRFFDSEGPVISFLNKAADLIGLNILMLLCCIPVVTAGASITAMYTITIKMVKKEEGYIAKGFFKAFKENFKQATLLWLIVLAVAVVFLADYWIVFYAKLNLPKIMPLLMTALFLIAYSTFLYLFPVLSRYENTLKNTVKNAFLLSLSNFPKTVLLIVIQMIPVVVIYVFPMALPLVVLLGCSLVAYLSSFLYAGIFKKLEKETPEKDTEETDNS